MGTHISKVKSLSMDSWTSAQVDQMKQNGNNLVNKKYNPKNVKPAPVLDIDDVDSVMEKFIRQKYQEMSLADGRPRPPERTASDYSRPPEVSRSPDTSSPPPALPPKKGKFFSFSLRSTSSAYPLSKHDKKRMAVEPTMDNAFRVSSPPPSLSSKQSRIFGANIGDDINFEAKLATLKDMGFPDDKRNSIMLKSLGGDLERTIESLVRLGEGSQPGSRNRSPRGSRVVTPTSSTFPDVVKGPTFTDVKSPTLKPPSFNPFDRPTAQQPQQQQHPSQQLGAHNPFGLLPDPQALEQSLNNLQISQQQSQPPQPLFPHSTGGYPSKPQPIQYDRLQQSMTPPVPSTHNPFFQSMPSAQASANPYALMMQPVHQHPIQAHNPFFTPNFTSQNVQSPQASEQFSQSGRGSFNPFQSQYGNTQNQQQLQQNSNSSSSQASNQQQQSNPFGLAINHTTTGPTPDFFSTNTSQYSQAHQPQGQQQNQQPQQMQQSFQQLQQTQHPVQPQVQQQPPPTNFQNPSFQSPDAFSPQLQNQFQQFQQPIAPQQTGRYDKTSILALYNYPQLAPPPLPTIMDEPSPSGEIPPQQQQSQTSQPQPQYTTQSSSSTAPFSNLSPKPRSVTAPLTTSSPSTTAGSRNPFLNAASPSKQPQSSFHSTFPPQTTSILAQHSSRESVDLAGLQNGRHSPDAFASLSSRIGR
ncbi:putative gtpase activating protein for [Phaeomoniella chlamydospora]|uniref:Putative gtpase activating protein for n=1 Tax=Phaeomoniella chlamydospora TaxID=158046 RepID=A0A0G2F2R6_PHACM|nr:putative gtpase activating protein for [Phaeomoniella chlamydospora]